MVCGFDKLDRAAWNEEVSLRRAAVAEACVLYIGC